MQSALHSMAEVERHLGRSSTPAHLFRAGSAGAGSSGTALGYLEATYASA